MKTKRSLKRPPRRKIGKLSATLTIAALGGLVAIGMLYYGQQPASAEPTIPAGAALTSWFNNGQGGQRLLQIYRGSAPPAGVRIAGTVLTDTDCAPDAQGLSHCHNRIDLANGQEIEIINTHIMSRHPCLSPGQAVWVRRFNAHWVVASDR